MNLGHYLQNGSYAQNLSDLDIDVRANTNAQCQAKGGSTRTGIYISCTLYVPKQIEYPNNIVNVDVDVQIGTKRCYAPKVSNFKGLFLCQELLPNITGQYLWGSNNYGFVEEGFRAI